MQDAIDRILQREGVYDRIRAKTNEAMRCVTLILESYRAYHGQDARPNEDVVMASIWNVLIFEPAIIDVILANDRFELSELQGFGGPVSRHVCRKVIEIVRSQGLLR